MPSLAGLDLSNIEPQQDWEPLPPGNYLVEIIDSEEKGNSKGTGTFHALTFKVLEGPHKNRRLIERLNLNNPNTVAVDIARKTLAGIIHAARMDAEKVAATEQLHNIPMVVRVDIEEGKGDWGPSNRIKGFKPADAAVPDATVTVAHQAAAAPSTTASVPPWQR